MPKDMLSSVVKIPFAITNLDADRLDQQSKICNWLYNYLLDQSLELRKLYCETKDPEIAKTLYTERGLRNLIPGLKKERHFLKTVHSSPLKNAALRLSASIQTYQKSRKNKRKGAATGWPRFRSWKRSWFSLLYDEPGKGFKLKGNDLEISLGMGMDKAERKVKVTLASTAPLKEKEIRNLRIVKQLGQFYAVFTVNIKSKPKPGVKKVIALDPNHKNLVYGVDTDGESIEIAAPNFLKNFDRRIDLLKAKRDRCKKKSKKIWQKNDKGGNTEKFYWQASRRYEKLSQYIEKQLRKRREQTKTFLYTTAQKLFDSYDLVSIGDYTPDGSGITKKMRRAVNNQSLIGRFKDILSWVALKSGKHFYEFDEKGTTRTCHDCSYVHREGLCPSIRKWDCPQCHTKHVRDENSARNGLRKVLRDLNLENLLPGSGPVLVIKRWAWRVLPQGVRVHLGEQNSDTITAPRNLNEDMVVLDQNHLIKFV